MLSEVKTGVPIALSNSRYSRIWMFYFLISIIWVGGIAAYFVALPCLVLGRFFRPLWFVGGIVLKNGVDFLMKSQPWYQLQTDVDLPQWKNFRAGYLTFSNHRSHLDMFILLTKIQNIRVVTKSALYKIPFLNIMLWALQNFPVKKGDKKSYLGAMEKMVEAIKKGDPVHLFPEMTRCEKGFSGIQAFHLFPFHVAMKAQVPMIPFLFKGTDHVWPKGVSGIAYGKKMSLIQLPAIHPKDFSSAEQLRDHCWKVLQEAY